PRQKMAVINRVRLKAKNNLMLARRNLYAAQYKICFINISWLPVDCCRPAGRIIDFTEHHKARLLRLSLKFYGSGIIGCYLHLSRTVRLRRNTFMGLNKGGVSRIETFSWLHLPCY